MNEAFLTSATVRDNIVNIAKLLNYVPKSVTSPIAAVKMEINTVAISGVYPTSVTLKKVQLLLVVILFGIC